jgi:ubiquinone/menaquinone biosynthesis C-methylase UbiE
MQSAQEIRGLNPRVKEYFALENAARSWWHTDGHSRYDRQLDVVTSEIDVGGKRVLDVATGRGRFAIRYVQNGARQVTAVDISKGMLEIAGQNARAAGADAHIEFVRADIEESEFQPESFDVVNCMELYVHLPNPTRVTQLLFQYLRAGGVLVANIDLPQSARRYFHWINEPARSLSRGLRNWPAVRYAYFKVLPSAGRALCHRLLGWPQHPRGPVLMQPRGRIRRLPTTDETIAALNDNPNLELSRAEDAICRMGLEPFVAMLTGAGFQIGKVIREGRWHQLPYGYIVIARKPG